MDRKLECYGAYYNVFKYDLRSRFDYDPLGYGRIDEDIELYQDEAAKFAEILNSRAYDLVQIMVTDLDDEEFIYIEKLTKTDSTEVIEEFPTSREVLCTIGDVKYIRTDDCGYTVIVINKAYLDRLQELTGVTLPKVSE